MKKISAQILFFSLVHFFSSDEIYRFHIESLKFTTELHENSYKNLHLMKMNCISSFSKCLVKMKKIEKSSILVSNLAEWKASNDWFLLVAQFSVMILKCTSGFYEAYLDIWWNHHFYHFNFYARRIDRSGFLIEFTWNIPSFFSPNIIR